MDLKLDRKNFIVCGATSGFGHAVAMQLLAENANVIAIARGEEKLRELRQAYPSRITIIPGDITHTDTIQELFKQTEETTIDGILVNAGGPPAKKFLETSAADWDKAYETLLRWKVELTRAFLPLFMKNKYGRFLFIESSAVKQPIENLILSTSLRLSVVGFVKSLSQEYPDKGVTFNIIAPGYHFTPAVERLINKKAEQEKISVSEAKQQMERSIPVGHVGNPRNFSALAVWLLSPLSDFVTGQVYAVDGGTIRATL